MNTDRAPVKIYAATCEGPKVTPVLLCPCLCQIELLTLLTNAPKFTWISPWPLSQSPLQVKAVNYTPQSCSQPCQATPSPAERELQQEIQVCSELLHGNGCELSLRIRQHQPLPYYSLSVSGIPTLSLNANPLLSHSGLFPWFLPLCAHGFKTYLCLFFSKGCGLRLFSLLALFFLAAPQDIQLSLLWHSLWT